MSIKNINVGLNVDSKGSTDREITKAKALKASLDAAADSAAKVGGTKGSRAAAAKAGPSGSLMSGEDYGRARGSAGTTGASARDFANQAQGLGGLVRLYATFAANIFAVGAAFSALRQAAQFEGIQKGLEQLGAAAGRDLTGLSKSVVALTAGAVSLREAMTSVAQATSAGLNPTQIEGLATVANKASQALGLNMTDALSRLSRGVSKIEPELLDELGIFVRVDQAAEKYALSIGKTASSLSDFERRQAFANAVIEQGKAKFDAIEAAANPYDKLLASASNLLTVGLNLLNKFIEPFVKLLSESPVALGTAIAAIAGILIKQAIPAVGQLRQGLRHSSEAALAAAENFKESFGDKFQGLLEKRFRIPDITADLAKTEAGLSKLGVKIENLPKSAQALAGGVYNEKNISNLLATRNKILDEGIIRGKKASAEQIENTKKEIAAINLLIQKHKQVNDLEAAKQGTVNATSGKIGSLDPEMVNLRKYEALRKQVNMTNAIANAAENASVIGIRASWDLLNKEIAEKGVTGFAKYKTMALGGLSAVASRVSGIIGAFGVWAEIAGIAVVAITSIVTWLANANKEQEKYNTSVDKTAGAVKTASDTIDLYTVKSAKAFSIDATVAFANSIDSITVALEGQLNSLESWERKANIFSKILGLGNESKLKDSVKNSLDEILVLISTSSKQAQQESYIASALGITPEQLQDAETRNKALEKLGRSNLRGLIGQFKEITKEQQYSAQALKGFSDGLRDIGRVFDEISRSTAFTDLQGKLGEGLLTQAARLGQVLEDPLRALQAIDELSKDPKALTILGDAADLKRLSEAAGLLKELNTLEEERRKANANVEQAKQDLGTYDPMGTDIAGMEAQRRSEALSAAEEEAKRLDEQLTKAKKKSEEYAIASSDIVVKITSEAFKRMELGVKQAERLAAISVQQARTQSAASVGIDTSRRDYELALEKIKIDKEQISAAYEQQKKLLDNTRALQDLRDSLDAEAAKIVLAKSGSTPEEKAKAEADLKAINARKQVTMAREAMAANAPLDGISSQAINAAKVQMGEEAALNLKLRNALANKNAEIEIAGIKRADQKLSFDRSISDELAKQAAISDQNNIKALQFASSLSNYASEDLINKQTLLNKSEQQKKYDLDREILARQISDIERKGAGYTDAEKSKIAVLKATIANLDSTRQQQVLETDIANIRELSAARLAKITEESEKAEKASALAQSVEEAKLSLITKQLDVQTQLGQIGELAANRQRVDLELAAQKVKFDAESLKLSNEKRKAEEESKRATSIQTAALDNYLANPESEAASAALDSANKSAADAKTKLDLANQAIEANTKINSITNETIKLNGSLNEKLIEQKNIMDGLTSIADTLASGFGDVAAGIGKSAKAMGEYLMATKKQYDTVEEGQIAETKGAAKVVGSVKTIFKEKTAAYRAFSAVEKALQLASLALEIKVTAGKIAAWLSEPPAKIASESATTAATAAGAGARAPITFAEIVGNFMAKMHPLVGTALGLAAGAMFMSLLGKGGGHSSAGFAPNSEQRQETQGTGMTWDANGNKIETGNGVFGDSEARSESIKNSLEIMKNNSIEGLDYDNQMLKAMQRLSEALTGASEAIYSIPGLRQGGKGFGTLASTSTVSKGGLFGTGFLGSVFGGGTTVNTSIESAGIQLRGSLEDIINDTSNSILQYKDVLQKFHEDGGWFGSDSDWTVRSREVEAVQDDVQSAIIDVFKNAKDMFTAIGKTADISAESVTSAFKSINFEGLAGDIDIVGLTGAETMDAINAVISSKLDETAKLLFSQFDNYKKFGEGYLETVVRVVDGNTKLDQALRSIGSRFDITRGGIEKFATSEALIKAAGGLENFMDQAAYFKDNFLTDLEKLVPVQKSVAAEMTRLKIPLNTSREGFKQLVLAQDLSTVAGQEMYQALMDLAPGFDEATKTMNAALEETVSKFTDFADKLKSFRDGLVLGNSSILDPTQKYLEAKTQFESTYAKALTGDKDAMSSLTGAASNFLTTSKDLYASSQSYADDFNTVLNLMDKAQVDALAKADVATLQLTALTTQVDLLTTINDNIAKIAGVPAKAAGGLARGLTLVGERGPELVDFVHPGQVYTADQTAGMFTAPSNGMPIGAMVGELQKLRQEVQQLRKDQQKQTGDLIMSNYDANQIVAEEVTTAVTESATQTAWLDRSKPTIK